MATLQVSSHNPFRSPNVTPNSTGPTVSSPTNPPPIPPRPVTEPSTVTSDSAVDDSTGLLDELPPAYTPSPDTRQGESTIEYGPRRPYQPPTPHLVNNTSRARRGDLPTLWSQLTGQAPIPTAGSDWSSFPGRRRRLLQPDHIGHTGFRTASQSSSHLQVPRAPSPLPPSPASDFARDFYAAGAGDEPEAAHSTPHPPVAYAPPPGPPPGPPPASSSTSNRVDNQPTSIPKPGHPLLRDGKLLVYPRGYECPKCMNLGYKRMDPTHPCKRCWSKFAKPFQGPLVTAYSNQSDSTSTSPFSSSFQRPLPSFHPPQRTPTVSRPQSYPPATPGPYVSPLQDPNVQIRALSPYGAPPPRNAVVYSSGDPRLGGRLCWRCEGTGTISLFLFDSTTCFVCGGVGRVFE